VTDHLAIVAPDEEFWEGMESLFAAAAIEMTIIRKLDLFVEHHLEPANTIVLVDADQNVDRRANFVSGLVRNRFAGVVTVSRDLSLSERVALFYMGADHCLVRPIDGEELAAIISNMFRHSRLAVAPVHRDEPTPPWKLDLRQWRLTTPGGHDIGLSSGEMSLLATLFREPGKTHLRDDLRAQSSGAADNGVGRSLDVQISRLRRKVEDASSMTLPLRSSRGAGYVFASPATIIPADTAKN
jgi:DNA-binding response OmpR family regulator